MKSQRVAVSLAAINLPLRKAMRHAGEIGADGVQLAERQEIGAIESKKAESDLFAPMAGNLLRFNESLISDPSWINVDKYERGWLFEMAGAGARFMSTQEYVEHLETVWEVTQRTIKGQLN